MFLSFGGISRVTVLFVGVSPCTRDSSAGEKVPARVRGLRGTRNWGFSSCVRVVIGTL